MKVSYNTLSVLTGIITGDSDISPYRSGNQLVMFFDELDSNLPGQQGFSRNPYTENVLHQINDTPTLEAAITSVFDPRNFLQTEYDIEIPVQLLNEYLKYDGYEVKKEGDFYHCREITPSIYRDGVQKVKNLIFAANGPKPEIVLEDAINNDIRIVKNAEFCLVYERDIPDNGLFWNALVDWWCEQEDLHHLERIDQERRLYRRLFASLAEGPETCFFKSYFSSFRDSLSQEFPALIPQVYLHYDPYTIAQLAGKKRLVRQRMDFLLLLSGGRRVVIEIDGKQHYSSEDSPGQNVASPKLYAEMVAEDRRLKLAGYDVYRFGGYELSNKESVAKITLEFFSRLFQL